MEASLALYRRYRPETFAEVIGQDHVTEPLRAALAANRVNHAYLFSGPRGCGKTTSARILARALNCARAPIADPCGECDSCVDLARGGPGSLDVIEIDAASHGGVDDARDLREKAFFSPVRDRFKVYVIDEAHMVSSQGFNALLKLVEEPPEHLKFVFATTEPDKVLPTIRSRTHHYPFRLIPPRTLSSYVGELCAKEGVRIEPAALPLVVRAGGGSARDTLSVLDQLLSGAGADGVTLGLATGLLGYTPESLLDEVVDAFAASDGGTVFGVVDKVIEAGQDPRRFTEDLLRRLRDLVVLAHVPTAAGSGLIDGPEDAEQRLSGQAGRFGATELVRAADLVAAGLTEMRGATAPRLLLELICARVLLPAADSGTDGLAARLDRLERRINPGGMPAPSGAAEARAAVAPAPAADPAPVVPTQVTPPAQPDPAPEAPAATAPRVPGPRTTSPEPPPGPAPGPASAPEPATPPAAEVVPEPVSVGVATRGGESAEAPATVEAPAAQASPATPVAPAAVAAAPAPAIGLADMRRLWPSLLERMASTRRYTWMLLRDNAQVVGVEARVLTLGFTNPGAKIRFFDGGNDELLRQAIIDEIGEDWTVEGVTDPSVQPGATPPPVIVRPAVTDTDTAPAAPAPAPSPAPSSTGWPETRRPPEPGPRQDPPAATAPDEPPDDEPPPDVPPEDLPPVDLRPPDPEPAPPSPAPADPPPVAPPPGDATAAARARAGIQPTRTPGRATAAPAAAADGPALVGPDAEVDPADPVVEDDLQGAALLERELGATLIEDIPHE